MDPGAVRATVVAVNTKPLLRDLPVKTIYIRGSWGPIPIEGHIAESVYDPFTGILEVHGLTDVTESEEGKNFLAQPASVGDESIGVPPIHRVYLGADPREEGWATAWILLQHDGIWTLVPIPRNEVTNPPPSPA